jgi:hypothetical protein
LVRVIAKVPPSLGSLPRPAWPGRAAGNPDTEDGDDVTVETTDYEGTTMLRRLRSAALLVVLLVVIGVATAGIVGLATVVVSSFLDHTLG